MTHETPGARRVLTAWIRRANPPMTPLRLPESRIQSMGAESPGDFLALGVTETAPRVAGVVAR